MGGLMGDLAGDPIRALVTDDEFWVLSAFSTIRISTASSNTLRGTCVKLEALWGSLYYDLGVWGWGDEAKSSGSSIITRTKRAPVHTHVTTIFVSRVYRDYTLSLLLLCLQVFNSIRDRACGFPCTMPMADHHGT